MTFLYPFALLGLIAIPILIIIYIIRNKYKEVTAPTTYIWEVAAKMLKRKNPFSAKIPVLPPYTPPCFIQGYSPVLKMKRSTDP